MDPDRSSRAAARRIVEDVLADHAARATALDGATPIVVPERPDTPAWRAARRIIEETLAEHAARAVIPATVKVDVVVDLDQQGVEVQLELDGHPPSPPDALRAWRAAEVAERAEPAVVVVVAPIDRDETAAKAARRIVETVLAEHGVEAESRSVDRGAPRAFELDPVPKQVENAGSIAPADPDPAPNGSIPADTTVAEPTAGTARESGVAEASAEPTPDSGPDGTQQVDTVIEPADIAPDADGAAGTATGTSNQSEADETGADETGAEPVAVSVDDDVLRAAIPERLFSPAAERDADVDDSAVDAAADGSLDGPATLDQPATGYGASASALPGIVPEPSTPVDLGPPDPDDPVVIASRIVADVLADRERKAEEVAAAGRGGPDEESTGTRVLDENLLFEEATEGGRAPSPTEDRSRGVIDGRVPVMGTPEDLLFDVEPGSPTADPGIDGLQAPDSIGYDPRPDPVPPEAVPEELWAEEPVGVLATDDEFGEWPDPIVPPRRTGRWLVTTVMGAVLLAVLLPLAIGALRDLVSFS